MIGKDFRRALFRTYLAALAACLPILALLLVPRLMRSRAGSEALLVIGSTLFVILVVSALVAAPMVSAVAAPLRPHWERSTVRATVRALRKGRPRVFWWTVGEFFAILVVSQIAGLGVALVAPYVASNPAHATDPAAPAWIIDYPHYALQACIIYLVICLAVAWYGSRLRSLSGGRPEEGGPMKTLALGLAALLSVCWAPGVRAGEANIDAPHLRFRRAVREQLTPEQLRAREEAFARRIAARRAALRTAVIGETPAETCPAATAEVSALPFGPMPDTTVGATNDYEPALSSTPTCSAPTSCMGRPTGRGEVYAGTGWGPDKAYRIRTDANCTLTIDLIPTDPFLTADDLGLLVYQAQCSNELTDCVCASDNGFPGNPDPNGNTEGVVLDAVARTDYFVVVDGYSSAGSPPGDAGPYTLGITGTGCSLVANLPSQYHTVPPCRLVDTRNPTGPFGGPALVAGASRTFTVAGSCGVPANATAVFLNATIVSPTTGGNLRIFTTGSLVPTVSALNYSANQTRGNNGIYALDDQGRLDLRLAQASGTAHVVVDVAGYFLE